MNKYQKIDRDKLSPKGKDLYDKLKKKSNNFEETDGKLGEILEAFYKKTQTSSAKAKPKKSTKPKPKSKAKAKPKSKAKPKAKKKTTKSKSGNTGSFAKLRAAIAKRDGITYKQALPIAKKEYAKQKESITKNKRGKTESRLSAYKRKYKSRGTEDVKERGSMRPLDIEKDSKIPALPRGKRVSKGTGANQYGKAKKGKVYYENRSNRTDVRQPSKKVAPPKLAKGGRINIINEGVKFDKKKYKGALGDFDKDGVPNIDDAKPLTKTGKVERVEQVELSKTFERLLKLKSQLDSTMNVAIDELDEVAPDGAQIYARTKTPYSILKKLVEKRLTDKNKGLTDLVGTTIAVDDYKDLRTVDKEIQKGAIGKVVEREDMYDSPKGGYRAVHYLVEADGYIIEVQLKTKRQKDVNVLSHNPYKKGTINKKYLLELTNLANKADKGNKNAIKEFNEIMKDKEKVERQLDTSYEFGGEIRRDYDVNINSGVGTYAKGGNVDKSSQIFVLQDDDYGNELFRGVDELNEYLQEFNEGYGENYKTYEDFNKGESKQGRRIVRTYAKGGWIQDAVEEMKEKGTVGAFTKQAKRREMTPVEFAKMVLKDPKEYSEKTRERAQFVKNTNPELFSFGGEIRRDYDVNINSGVGTYARGGKLSKEEITNVEFAKKHARGYVGNDFLDKNPSDRDILKMINLKNDLAKAVNGISELKKQYGVYSGLDIKAKGGEITEAGDVDFPSELLNYAKGGIAWQNRDDIDYYSVDVDTFDDQYRDFSYKDYDSALAKYKEVVAKDEFNGEELDNVQLLVVFEDGNYHTELSKMYAKGGKTERKVYNVAIRRKKDGYWMDLLPFDVTKSQAEEIAKDINGMIPNSAKAEIPLPFAKGGKTQGYNARLDESLGDRTGAEIDFEQKKKDRRDESKAMEKSSGKRAYSSVRTMDRNNRFLNKGGKIGYREH